MAPNIMYVFAVLVIIILDFSDSVYVEKRIIKAKTKIELNSIEVDTGLNEMIKLNPPILGVPEVLFIQLIRPDGETFSLEDNMTSTAKPLVVHLSTYKSSEDYGITTTLKKAGKTHQLVDLNKNSTFDGLVIGPLMEEDHGNWALSAFFKDIDGQWVQMFQVITIRIIEYIPNHQKETKRRIEDDFYLSFAYPIKNLDSCQLIGPKGSNPNSVRRDENTPNSCGYVVKNLTQEDEGIWEIIGVGKIIFRGQTLLKVINKKHVKS